MAANPNWNDLVVTTLRHRRKTTADNVTEHNALLTRIKETGGYDPAPGGRTLVEEIDFDANEAGGWYAGYEPVALTPHQPLTAAEFDWKNNRRVVMASGDELLKNEGPDAILKMLNARIKNAVRSLTNDIGAGVYAIGTESGGKTMGGLRFLVADSPSTGSPGGHDRSTEIWWRNQSDDDEITSATTAIGLMQSMWLSLVRGSDKPDLIVADTVTYTAFWSALTDIQRITEAKKGVSGYRSIAFAGPNGEAPVVFDDQCPANHMYFLNTKYLKYRPHKNRNFHTDEQIRSMDQDAVLVPIYWMGNMTCSNASLQGVIFDGD